MVVAVSDGSGRNHTMRRFESQVIVGLFLVGLSACGSADGEAKGASPQAASAGAERGGLPTVPTAPAGTSTGSAPAAPIGLGAMTAGTPPPVTPPASSAGPSSAAPASSAPSTPAVTPPAGMVPAMPSGAAG